MQSKGDQSMFDKTFPNSSIRQTNIVSKNEGVRVVRLDPEGVLLQLRRRSSFTKVYLLFPQARELAQALIEACEYESANGIANGIISDLGEHDARAQN
jgi:hypothetical protein